MECFLKFISESKFNAIYVRKMISSMRPPRLIVTKCIRSIQLFTTFSNIFGLISLIVRLILTSNAPRVIDLSAKTMDLTQLNKKKSEGVQVYDLGS